MKLINKIIVYYYSDSGDETNQIFLKDSQDVNNQ